MVNVRSYNIGWCTINTLTFKESKDYDTRTLITTLLSYTKTQGRTLTDSLNIQNLHHHGCPTTRVEPVLDQKWVNTQGGPINGHSNVLYIQSTGERLI